MLTFARGSCLFGPVVTGLLFGGAALVGMTYPVVLEHGFFFDARTVVLSISALFGGPVAAAISGAMAAGYRLWSCRCHDQRERDNDAGDPLRRNGRFNLGEQQRHRQVDDQAHDGQDDQGRGPVGLLQEMPDCQADQNGKSDTEQANRQTMAAYP